MRSDEVMGTRRYAVIGTGAIGGYYGARLAAAGMPVTFLGRGDVDALNRAGLSVTSPDGDIELGHVTATDDPAAIGPVDVVLVTIKTTGQASLVDALPPLIGPDTIVVSMQNGFGLEGDLATLVPDATMLGGMCFICAQRVAPGRIAHLDYGGVTVAEYSVDDRPAGITAAVQSVAEDFTKCGVEVHARGDLAAARWQKLVWNMPFNGLSVVLDAGTDELVGDPATEGLVRALMNEVATIAEAHGHGIGAHFVDKMIDNTRAMTPYAPSMKLDFDAGRAMELAAIYDAPLAIATRLGVATPALSSLAAQLHFLDARNRGRNGHR